MKLYVQRNTRLVMSHSILISEYSFNMAHIRFVSTFNLLTFHQLLRNLNTLLKTNPVDKGTALRFIFCIES